MKKILVLILMSLFCRLVTAKEVITLVSYNSPAASVWPLYLKIVETANSIQNKFTFVLVSKPGAQGLIAINSMNEDTASRLAVIAPPFVELVETKKINQDDYIPISSQGDACWILIANVGDEKIGINSLRGQKDLTVGSIGAGGASELVAFTLGDKLNFDVRPIVFKSTSEALIQMVGDNSINLVLDTPDRYLDFKKYNPRLQALGANCPTRNPKLPNVKTFREQGYDVPGIWYFIISNKSMPVEQRKVISEILDQSMISIGQQWIFKNTNFTVPIFNGISTNAHFTNSISRVNRARKTYESKINAAQ